MTLSEKIALVAGFFAIIGGVAAGIRWLKGVLMDYLRELKPNSGSSMNDRLTRVETRLDDLYKILISRHAD